MHRIYRKYFYLLATLSLLWLFSCEEQTTWELQNNYPIYVVDAIITSEFKAQQVYVYKSSGELNKITEPVLDASVIVTDGSNQYAFSQVGENGLYVSTPFAVAIDKTYALLIDYNGIKDTAYAKMEPITPFKHDTLIVKDGLYKFIYGGSDLPAMTEVSYDWSGNNQYCTAYGSCTAANTFYTLNNIDVAEEFGSAKQEIWFPAGTKVIRRKYSLSEAHQDFIRSLLIETEWRGGLFDTEQGNIPTNFTNSARGWFGVCMVLNDTIVAGL